MKNNQLFQIAGWCALAAALLMLAIHVLPSGTSNMIGLIITIGTMLGLTVVFYALYYFHRVESAQLSLTGLVLWILAFVLNLFSLIGVLNTFLGYLASFFWLLPFLIFGYLAYQTAKIPRGLAVVALLCGISLLIATAAGIMGSDGVVNAVSLIADIFMLVWAVWLGFVFMSKKFTAP
jgi:hypothetical protein